MMKLFRSQISFFCWLTLFMLTMCGKDEPAPEPEIIISTESISFETAGETKPFFIKSNLDWEIISSQPWLTLTPTSGKAGTIKIEATAAINTLTEIREATVTVKIGSFAKDLSITQAAASVLTIAQKEFAINVLGDQITLGIQSSGTYTATLNADWITADGGTAEAPRYKIKENPSLVTRQGTITFTLNDLTQIVTISQVGNALTIPADNTGMSDDAMTLASKMKLGWNLGNSLEATSGLNANGTYTASETLWGNPRTTKALIDAVKAAGFNTVRIPCAWSGYIEDPATNKIKDSWLTRVKEVIDYCIENDMYVMINVHWDGGWLENNATPTANVAAINAKQKALWEQIAVAFRNYDQHLLFAGTNEVHGDGSVAQNVPIQESFLKTFIDAVRATGGRNTYRNLIVQTYVTNIDYGYQYFTLPTDPTSNRLMAEVHYYDPWDFCGLMEDADWATAKYYWGAEFAGNARTSNWGQEAWVDSEFSKMKTKFVDNKIPVILGEYGAILRTSLTGAAYTNHVKARNNYLNFITKKALDYGMIPVYWDNGVTGNNGFGLFNRSNNTVAHPDAVQAIVSAMD